MHEWQSLSHVRWECKYHVVIIPKYRRKVIYGDSGTESARSSGSCADNGESNCWKGMQGPTMSTCA